MSLDVERHKRIDWYNGMRILKAQRFTTRIHWLSQLSAISIRGRSETWKKIGRQV